MEKFFCWIDKAKTKDDTLRHSFLKFAYLLFLKAEFVGLANVLAPFLYTVFIPEDKKELLKWGIAIAIVLTGMNIFHYVAIKYKRREYEINSGHSKALQYVQSICKIYNERISDRKYIGLFESVSDAVCADIYHFFKDVYGVETRTSIVQQYTEKKKNKCVLISRTSKKTQCLGRKKDDSEVKYSKDQKYYKKILLDNSSEIVIMKKEEIDKHFVFRKNNNGERAKRNNILVYIGIPQKVYGSKIAFLLQMDIMETCPLCEADENYIINFCETYFNAMVRVLQNAYLNETLYESSGNGNDLTASIERRMANV